MPRRRHREISDWPGPAGQQVSGRGAYGHLLNKGETLINGNNDFVDEIGSLPGYPATIHETCVSTIYKKTQRFSHQCFGGREKVVFEEGKIITGRQISSALYQAVTAPIETRTEKSSDLYVGPISFVTMQPTTQLTGVFSIFRSGFCLVLSCISQTLLPGRSTSGRRGETAGQVIFKPKSR